jgi:diphosphomevalonate decarboxylase
MKRVKEWRRAGIAAAYTLDAGPNVHILCEVEAVETVRARLEEMSFVRQVLVAPPGGPARLVESEEHTNPPGV